MQGGALWLAAIPLTSVVDGPIRDSMLALALLLVAAGLERFTFAARAAAKAAACASAPGQGLHGRASDPKQVELR